MQKKDLDLSTKLENPWAIRSIYELQFYNCPTCVFKIQSKQKFINHTYENHPWAVEYLNEIKDGSLKDVDCPWSNGNNPNANDFQDQAEDLEDPGEEKSYFYFDNDEPNDFIDENIDNTLDCDDDDFHENGLENDPLVTGKCKYVHSQRGKNLILDEVGHLYRHQKNSADNTKSYYCCVEAGCPARVHTPINVPKILVKTGLHSHATHSEKVNPCEHCDETFSNPGQLVAHVNSAHKGLKAFQCDICGKELKRASNLKEHMKSHNKPKKPRKVKTEDEVTNEAFYHFNQNHTVDDTLEQQTLDDTIKLEALDSFEGASNDENNEYTNKNVQQDMVSRYVKSQQGKNLLCDGQNYLYRINQHSADKTKTFYCCIETNCPARVHTVYGSPKIVKKMCEHSHPPNEGKIHTCHLCGMSFSKAGRLIAHINRTHKGLQDYQCETCGQNFTRSAKLLEHIQHVHEGLKKDKNFKCDTCEKAFTYSKDLREHISTVHEKIKNHTCNYCGKSFGRSSNLRIHIFSVHEGGTSYKCEFCEKIFYSKGGLKNHVTGFHEGLRNHVCELCGKAFAQLVYLKNHKTAVHEKQKPFQCDKCDRAFITSTKLKFHISFVHEGIKKHKCESCDKGFENPANLRAHITTVHEGIKNFKCEHCLKLFGKRSTLNRHINKNRCKGPKILEV